jgi:hypothetical protein
VLRRRSKDGGRPAGRAGGAAGETSPVDEFQVWVDGLEPRWQEPVRQALGSRERFLVLVGQASPGPTRDWLEGLRPTVDEAVRRVADAVWRAIRASEISAGLALDTATEELKQARRELAAAQRRGSDTATFQERVDAMARRHRAVNDALNLAEDTMHGLEELNVRLDTAVAQAATVVLRSSVDTRAALDRELDEVIAGLTAIDDALEGFAD